MVSRYSVIQYVPDPISDERINFGVVAFDEDRVLVRFLAGWERVRCFGHRQDLPLLKDFARQMEASAKLGQVFPGDQPNGLPRHERLLKVAQGSMNAIQFTEPKGSLEPTENLLEDMAQIYLKEMEQQPKARDRQAAARITINIVRDLLIRQVGPEKAKGLLKRKYELLGRHQAHTFDVAVANGKPCFAAHGISFEVQPPETVRDALAWMIADVKESSPDFPLAVMALPPKQAIPDYDRLVKLYEETTHTYTTLGARVLEVLQGEEQQLSSWVVGQLERING
ncbi:DUF3037 domain-containing protein [Leptolyngbya sp. PCC 6406]|uniref:DUF3037 domain-containing protein n=1 Tax=Leptolyngbya sp. PCC 6406 TaxID=1173264 RepID=UPI0002ACC3A9|nr:DUF3037 domain-containing protein [Leptolyngbya sp. PCC 6406]